MQDWRSSMVPDRCLARVACRIEPGDTPARFVAHLQEIAERAIAGQGGHVEVTMADQGQRLVMGPFDVPTNDPFVSLVGACYREVTGKEPVVGEVAPYKYYGTDGAHLRDAGMIGVVCGPGGKYNTMPDERVAIADIVAAARLYTLAALRSCAPRRT
jgi:acetylornithine deacetylase